MKIWLDDVRPMPDDFDMHFKDAETLGIVLRRIITEEVLDDGVTEDGRCTWNEVTHISFDNDLGEGRMEGHRLLAILEGWTVAYELTHCPTLTVHSANPVAAQRMRVIIDRIQHIVDDTNTALADSALDDDAV